MNVKWLAFVLVAAVVGSGATYLIMKPDDQTAAVPNTKPASPTFPTNKPLPLATSSSGYKFVHFRVGERNVKDMYADGDVMWVGTTGGLVRYDTKTQKPQMINAKNGLKSNGVFHVSKIGNRIALGTYGGGLTFYDPATNAFEHYNIPEGLGDPFVYDVVQAKNGDLWIATWSGVNRVRGGDLKDPSKWELFTKENTHGGLINDWVYGLAEGRNGDIWLATEGGLVLYRDAKWQNWDHKKGLGADYALVKNDPQYGSDPSKVSKHHAKQKMEQGLSDVSTAYNPNYIISMTMDQDGSVWAGTWGGGLAHFDGERWTNLTMKDGLPGNYIFMLHRDAQGSLWVGTNNGLAKRHADGTYTVMTTNDGLFSNTVFSMATQGDGNLWVGSYGGVAFILNKNMPEPIKQL